MALETTIAAVATAPGQASVAIVRMSGPQVRSVLRRVFRPARKLQANPRRLFYGKFIDPSSKLIIDNCCAVFFEAPHSFTGEDLIEFQLHGSTLIVQHVLRALYALGVSAAEPGEFSKRAFLNGKLDLVQAEALCDLIYASSERALEVAREQLDGRLSGVIDRIGEPLRNLLAELEASIDFPDEGIEPQTLLELSRQLSEIRADLNELIASYAFGAVVKDGYRVLLFGPPNVGKSSLLNLLLGRERAIVTPIAGTTRDLLEEELQIEGFKFIFCDSAGITESVDPIEKIGIELANERIEWADLVLCMVDASDQSGAWERSLASLAGKAKQIWLLINKIDLYPQAIGAVLCDSTVCHQNLYLSVKTGDGFEMLKQKLVEEISHLKVHASESSVVLTNERQRGCLSRAVDFIARANEGIRTGLAPEYLSVELRAALGALEELVGKTSTEDILGRIFSKFCIGK